MLTILIVLAIIGAVLVVPSPEKKPAPVVVEQHHHHHTVIVQRPVYVQAQVQIIQAKILVVEAKKELEPVRLPEARALVGSTSAIERYRRNQN